MMIDTDAFLSERQAVNDTTSKPYYVGDIAPLRSVPIKVQLVVSERITADTMSIRLESSNEQAFDTVTDHGAMTLAGSQLLKGYRKELKVPRELLAGDTFFRLRYVTPEGTGGHVNAFVGVT